jgi:hypothetical protein
LTKTMPLRFGLPLSIYLPVNIIIAVTCKHVLNFSITPQWSPATLEEVKNEDVDRVFQPFSSEQELHVPSDDSNR